jgi:hypothetical protein
MNILVEYKNKTGESKEFLSIRKAVKFTGLYHSYIAKYMKISSKYIGEIIL